MKSLNLKCKQETSRMKLHLSFLATSLVQSSLLSIESYDLLNLMPTSRYPCTQQRHSQDGLSINQNQVRIPDISCSKTRNLNLSPHAVLGAPKRLEFEISHSLRTESLPSNTLHSKVRTDPTRLPFASSLR